MKDAKLCYISGQTAYFTTASLEDQWGDDWNDAPYEHNAGSPYEWREGRGVPEYKIYKLKFESSLETPGDIANLNSPWSVESINSTRSPWLQTPPWSSEQFAAITAGTTLEDFIKTLEARGDEVYLTPDMHRALYPTQ